MSNRQKSGDEKKIVHAPGERKGRGLCGKKGRSSNVLEDITCLACGRRAQAALDALLAQQEAEAAQAHERQAEGVRLLSQPRWWEARQEASDG